jgi:hypothetical protein
MVAIEGEGLGGTRETGKKTLVHMVLAWPRAMAGADAEQGGEKTQREGGHSEAAGRTGTGRNRVTIDAMGFQREIVGRS